MTPSTTWSPSSGPAETPPGAGTSAAGVLGERLQAVAAGLGVRFDAPELLALALSHSSWSAESAGSDSNERLEFLGDAVLGLAVADHCYRTYPDMPEGQLAKVRAAVVSTTALARVATDLHLGEALLLGRGEAASGGRDKPSILADTLEAVIGAVYLDSGWEAARDFVLGLLGEGISVAAAVPGSGDFKSLLQESTTRDGLGLPVYSVSARGPDHAREFLAEVSVGGRVLGRGMGRSKKDAEQAAAREAIGGA